MAFTLNYFAFLANFLNRGSNFHYGNLLHHVATWYITES